MSCGSVGERVDVNVNVSASVRLGRIEFGEEGGSRLLLEQVLFLLLLSIRRSSQRQRTNEQTRESQTNSDAACRRSDQAQSVNQQQSSKLQIARGQRLSTRADEEWEMSIACTRKLDVVWVKNRFVFNTTPWPRTKSVRRVPGTHGVSHSVGCFVNSRKVRLACRTHDAS